MPLRDIEELCRGIVPGAGTLAVVPLGVGLLTETYRVARDGVLYALKIAAAHRPELGIDLAWEARLLSLAAAAGLAPAVVYCGPNGDVLLTRWAAGRPWSSEDARNPANLQRVAALLRRVHALKVSAPPRALGPARWIEIYRAALSKRNLPAEDPALHAAAAVRVRELERWTPGPLAVCHSDLHALNLIEQDDALILIDWEYAHVADPLWDLAGWSANNQLDPESQWRLLSGYAGRSPPSGDWQRLRLLLWLYDYVSLLWSQLYIGLRSEAGNEAAEQARLLDARLRLPAHYAA